MSTTPTPEGVSDEQIIELAYQHLCYWNEDHIRFARAVLALSSSARDQEGVRYEREAYRVFMDGNQWCAVGPAFIDLQQSPAGFADTPYLALERLTEAEGEDMRRALRAADWKDAPAAIPEAPPYDQLPIAEQAAKLVEELDARADQITRYSNSPDDGLMSAAARMIERLANLESDAAHWYATACREQQAAGEYLIRAETAEAKWATKHRYHEEMAEYRTRLEALATPQPPAQSAVTDAQIEAIGAKIYGTCFTPADRQFAMEVLALASSAQAGEPK